MFARILSYLLIPALLFAMESITQAAEVEVPLIADTLLAGHSAENNTNCGARDRLRVKGYQGIVVYRFDMSELEGQKVEGGILTVYCAGISGDAQGKTFSEKISTIAHDWVEGLGDYTVSEDSATFLWPGKEIADSWGDDNNDGQARYGPVDALDVINGNGGSIVNSQGLWDFVVTEWTEIELDAELVQGLVDGEQYGIAIWRDTVGVNLDLASRENADGAFAATLVVTTSGVAVDVHGKLASTWGTLKSIR
ncbi:hypothetical protein ACFL6S_11700 [Candidatus Poribacteria bacterium]